MKTINNCTARRIRSNGHAWLSRCWLTCGLLLSACLVLKASMPISPPGASNSDTLVSNQLTRTKTKNIEDIRPGERVLTFDFANEQWRPCRVLRLLVHDYEGDVITIGLGAETISATGNHPFWIIEGESLASRPLPADFKDSQPSTSVPGRWVEARDLRNGDRLRVLGDAIAVVSSLSSRWDSLPVYNLEVEDLHTYAVGKSYVLVHNKVPENPPKIYRTARPGRQQDVRARPNEKGRVSFRDSISNPVKKPDPPAKPPLRDTIIEVDTSKLPPGTVHPDGGTIVDGTLMPDGHVSVTATPEEIVKATTDSIKLPRGQ